MIRTRIAAVAAASAWALSFAACCADAPPPPPPPPPASPPALPQASTAAPPKLVLPGRGACKLPAPKKSDDACTTDADCGPSEPCHASACVAKAKAQPRTPTTMCTEIMKCDSADANRCGCFEGRCALIPPQG